VNEHAVGVGEASGHVLLSNEPSGQSQHPMYTSGEPQVVTQYDGAKQGVVSHSRVPSGGGVVASERVPPPSAAHVVHGGSSLPLHPSAQGTSEKAKTIEANRVRMSTLGTE